MEDMKNERKMKQVLTFYHDVCHRQRVIIATKLWVSITCTFVSEAVGLRLPSKAPCVVPYLPVRDRSIGMAEPLSRE